MNIGSGFAKETVRASLTMPTTVNGFSVAGLPQLNCCPIGFLPGHRGFRCLLRDQSQIFTPFVLSTKIVLRQVPDGLSKNNRG